METEVKNFQPDFRINQYYQMKEVLGMNWNSIRAALTTPTEVPRQGPRVQTNLDTDLLKLVAIVSMLIDHVGGAFSRRPGPSAGSGGWRSRFSATA